MKTSKDFSLHIIMSINCGACYDLMSAISAKHRVKIREHNIHFRHLHEYDPGAHDLMVRGLAWLAEHVDPKYGEARGAYPMYIELDREGTIKNVLLGERLIDIALGGMPSSSED